MRRDAIHGENAAWSDETTGSATGTQLLAKCRHTQTRFAHALILCGNLRNDRGGTTVSEELANTLEESPFTTEPVQASQAVPASSVSVKIEPRTMGAGGFRFACSGSAGRCHALRPTRNGEPPAVATPA